MEHVVQIPNRRGPVDTPHLFCPVEDGSNPGGDRDTPSDPNPLFWARGGERERDSRTQWERNREEQQRGEKERVGRRRESRREWEGESGREWLRGAMAPCYFTI